MTYRWTAPAAGAYSVFLTSADFDAILALRSGCGGAEVGCNPLYWGDTPPAAVTVTLSAGEPLFITVDGQWEESGNYSVLIQPADAPTPSPIPTPTRTPDFRCVQVDLATALEASVSGDTSSSTNTHGDTWCDGGNSNGSYSPDVTYRWTAPVAGTYSIETSNVSFALSLTVRADSCTGPQIACVGLTRDQSQTSVTVAAGESLVLIIDGLWTESGTYDLAIHPGPTPTPTPTPVVDCGQLDLGSAVPAVASGTMADATDAREAGACGGSGAPDVAYRWTAPADGLYTFDTSVSDFDTLVSVRSNCSAASQLACTNSSPSLTWDSARDSDAGGGADGDRRCRRLREHRRELLDRESAAGQLPLGHRGHPADTDRHTAAHADPNAHARGLLCRQRDRQLR